jgi:hypothetical protein
MSDKGDSVGEVTIEVITLLAGLFSLVIISIDIILSLLPHGINLRIYYG